MESSCPPIDRLRDLLEGRLPTEEQTELQSHLDFCSSCRQRLEKLVGDFAWLSDPTRAERQAEAPVGKDLREVIDRLLSSRNSVQSQSPAPEEDKTLDFLTPTDRGGFLGRFGPYEIIELVGRGGMGIVLKGLDPSLNRNVAIKVLAPQLAVDASARKRFLREARAAAAVSHDHVVTIHAVDEANGLPYLVMEYVPGKSLQGRIDATGPLQLKEILRIGSQIAAGLAAAHAQGLVHRDIKPANILLENGIERVKITDFGLAKAAGDVSITQTGLVAGTPQYMAPEQARGERVDERADLFSLGSVLYAMCTGRAPFPGQSTFTLIRQVCEEEPPAIQEANPEIPRWLVEVIERLMSKDPAARLQPAGKVAELLGRHLARVQQPPVPPPPPPPVDRVEVRSGAGRASHRDSRDWRVRRIWLWGAVLLVLLASLLALAELTGMTGLLGLFRNPQTRLVTEHKKPPPLPQPGFVLHGPSAAGKRFPTIGEAVEAAGAGDAIELRWDGVVEGPTLRIEKPLTLRAAEGFRPVFQMNLGDGPRLDAGAPLVVEGIEFRFVFRRPQLPERLPTRPPMMPPGIVVSRDAPLYVAHCRFVLKPPSARTPIACVNLAGSTACELRNCLFFAPGASAVRWMCSAGGRLNIHNSVFCGLTAIDLRAFDTASSSICLTRNTFCGSEVLRVGVSADPADKILRVTATQNAFSVGSVLTCPEPVAEKLAEVVGWQDKENLFDVGIGFIVQGRRDLSGASVESLEQWNRLFEQGDTGSQTARDIMSLDLNRKVRNAPEELAPEDFLLETGQAGAKVEITGPGEAFDRWRSSADYQEWLTNTERVKRGDY